MIGFQRVHISQIARPETLVFQSVHGEEKLAERFTCLKMKVKIAISRRCYEEENRFHTVNIIHHGAKHSIFILLCLPVFQSLQEIFLSELLQKV